MVLVSQKLFFVDEDDMIAYYKFTEPQMKRLMSKKIIKFRVEDDMSYADYTIQNLGKRFKRLYDILHKELYEHTGLIDEDF